MNELFFWPNNLRKQSFAAGVIFILFFSSCIDTKKLKYFSNLSDSTVVHLPNMQRTQATIMSDDILEIKIAGANDQTAAIFNTYSSPAAGASAMSGTTGVASAGSGGGSANSYIVDINGDIEFPIIGKIKASGLTKDQFKEKLRDSVSRYLKDPLISVKFSNFRFTILGEVKMPGTFTVPNERVTILEALGLAGDMTIYSRRADVKVLRDSNGVREVGMVDFGDKALFTSKYYYLQRNDVIYIQAEKTRTRFDDFARISTIVTTLASLLAITLTIIRR